jgi:hypothetical protein
MGDLFPNFVFKPVYAVGCPDNSVHKFNTLREAQIDAARDPDRKIIGGFTWGNYSEIYLTAAAEAEIPGLKSTSREQTMRFVIMHEWGHQGQGGGCAANDEVCADNFSLNHQGAENVHR